MRIYKIFLISSKFLTPRAKPYHCRCDCRLDSPPEFCGFSSEPKPEGKPRVWIWICGLPCIPGKKKNVGFTSASVQLAFWKTTYEANQGNKINHHAIFCSCCFISRGKHWSYFMSLSSESFSECREEGFLLYTPYHLATASGGLFPGSHIFGSTLEVSHVGPLRFLPLFFSAT